jgi:hypothetical protein
MPIGLGNHVNLRGQWSDPFGRDRQRLISQKSRLDRFVNFLNARIRSSSPEQCVSDIWSSNSLIDPYKIMLSTRSQNDSFESSHRNWRATSPRHMHISIARHNSLLLFTRKLFQRAWISVQSETPSFFRPAGPKNAWGKSIYGLLVCKFDLDPNAKTYSRRLFECSMQGASRADEWNHCSKL